MVHADVVLLQWYVWWSMVMVTASLLHCTLQAGCSQEAPLDEGRHLRGCKHSRPAAEQWLSSWEKPGTV